MYSVRKDIRFAQAWLLLCLAAAGSVGANFIFGSQLSTTASVLGYEPDLFYADEHNCSDSVTLFLHGWTDSYKQVSYFKKRGVIKGCAASFNFYDASGHKYLHAAFGQLPDALAACWALKTIYATKNPKSFILYGYSRGGAALINTLAVLNNYEEYKDLLIQLTITKDDAKQILNRIEQGCIILDCPLIHLPTTLKNGMPYIPPWLSEFVLSKISRYRSDGMHPLYTVKKLHGLNLTTLVHYQHNDRVVFNDHDASFYKELYELNPDTTYLVLGHCGGHMHNFSCLKKPITKLYDARSHAEQPHIKDQAESGLMRVGKNVHKIIKQFKQACENQ